MRKRAGHKRSEARMAAVQALLDLAFWYEYRGDLDRAGLAVDAARAVRWDLEFDLVF